MSRTRCVQFYWRKFSRLVKFFSSVDTCRRIKAHYKFKVDRIQRQYKVHKLRQEVNRSIREKRAIVV